MMDIYDGLVISLHDLAEASGVWMDVTKVAILRLEGMPDEDATWYALFSGDDFELLFTCPSEVFPVGGLMRHALSMCRGEKECLWMGKHWRKLGMRITGSKAEPKTP